MRRNIFYQLSWAILHVACYACVPKPYVIPKETSTIDLQAISNYVVLGLNGDLVVRMALENEMVNLLRTQGIRATAGWEVNPIQFLPDTTYRKSLFREMREKGYQGAICLSILEMKEKLRYVKDTLTYEPLMYQVPYKSNLLEIYWQIHIKGAIKSVNVLLQGSIYDLTSGQLLWSSRTSMTNPESVNMLAKSHAQVLLKKITGYEGTINNKIAENE